MRAASSFVWGSFAWSLNHRPVYKALTRCTRALLCPAPRLASTSITRSNILSRPHPRDRQQSGTREIFKHQSHIRSFCSLVSISSGATAARMPRVRWQCTRELRTDARLHTQMSTEASRTRALACRSARRGRLSSLNLNHLRQSLLQPRPSARQRWAHFSTLHICTLASVSDTCQASITACPLLYKATRPSEQWQSMFMPAEE